MKAVSTFRTPPYSHNCAQAIAYKWHRLYPQGLKIVDDFAPYRGGNAPGGMCGALYAAIQAAPEHKDELMQTFRGKIGAIHCVDIKKCGKVPCQICVDTADQLLEEMTNIQ